ncbi:glycosyltransferase family protein [Flavobacterium pallidum]|uniref:UDP-glycosyltransferase n=1 Tax=Flavobacterium pallidum TaxID=2172098 RepID=A0A2S1SH13_9FLAO|nr:UDP-glycosyltransferase [Flavobacterium pallidum]AWI25659.1 UDP-glycosyltransferase [Flavobacterium pallidum]
MNSIRKILIVTDSIDIEDSSGSKANVALIHNLAAAGYDIEVYHYTLREISLKDVKTHAIKEIKYSPLYFLSRIQRVLSRRFNIEMSHFLQGIFGFSFTFFNDAHSIVKALKNNKFDPDLVMTLSKGSSFRPHYALLELPGFHNKWMAYVHDPFPFHFYPRPYNWIESSYRQKENFFREVSEKARYSAFPSLLLMEWMGSYFENFLKTGILIPHQNADYEVKDIAFPHYFDETKFNLLHAGNLMKQRSPEGLLKGFVKFLENNPDVRPDSRLLLIGAADYHLEMLENYKKFEPEIYLKTSGLAFDTVFNLQKNADVNIILESKSEISPFLPAKFPHCVSANKIILSLAPYYSETRRLLGHDYPFWSEADDVEKIAGLIEKLYMAWKYDKQNLLLNRNDLKEYLSADYLRTAIEKLR